MFRLEQPSSNNVTDKKKKIDLEAVEEHDKPAKHQGDMFPLDDHFVFTMAAPRKSGKSYLINMMLKSAKFRKRFDHIVIMCMSLDLNDDYLEFMNKKDDKFTFISDPEVSDIEELFEKQMECMRTVRKRQRAGFSKQRCPNTLLILDDILDAGLIQFHGIVDTLAARGRHCNISVIIASQRITSISIVIRDNSDYFLIFAPFTLDELEKYIEKFVSRKKRGEFISAILEVFEVPHDFVLLDKHEKSRKQKFKIMNAQDFMINKYEYLDEDLFT